MIALNLLTIYNLCNVPYSERGLYDEAILLLEKCIAEDYSHERAHTLLSQCLLEKYKSRNKINEHNEPRMRKEQKEVKDKGKCDTRFGTMRTNTNVGIKGKTTRKANMNLILSFATKVKETKSKKLDVISSHFKSFHFLRHNIMAKTKKNNDNNNNKKKQRKYSKNDLNYYDEHDKINVTSTATLIHNNNNHKTHLQKEDYSQEKVKNEDMPFPENREDQTKREIHLLYRNHANAEKDKRNEISMRKEFYINKRKVFPNQLIQISHFEPIENDVSLHNK